MFKYAQEGKINLDEEEIVEIKPDLEVVADKPGVFGQVILRNVIDFSQSFCLNESTAHTWENLFQAHSTNYLESDCDEQLLLNIKFSEFVDLHSFSLKVSDMFHSHSPKTIKLFRNENSFDFDNAESSTPVHSFILTSQHYIAEKLVTLDPFKWQNISSITIFVADNLKKTQAQRLFLQLNFMENLQNENCERCD